MKKIGEKVYSHGKCLIRTTCDFTGGFGTIEKMGISQMGISLAVCSYFSGDINRLRIFRKKDSGYPYCQKIWGLGHDF